MKPESSFQTRLLLKKAAITRARGDDLPSSNPLGGNECKKKMHERHMMRPVALRSTTTSRDVVRSCEPGHRDATTILGIVIRRATHKQQDAECKSRGDEIKTREEGPLIKASTNHFFLSYQAHLICFIGFNARYFLFLFEMGIRCFFTSCTHRRNLVWCRSHALLFFPQPHDAIYDCTLFPCMYIRAT